MIRALSLTAALALLPLSSALAQNAASQNAASQAAPARGVAHDPDSAEARLEAAADAFEARMEAFGKRAEAISEDPNLSESARGQSIGHGLAQGRRNCSTAASSTALAGHITVACRAAMLHWPSN